VSSENVELVRRVLDAWNRRDTGPASELLADDIVWEPATGAALEGAVYRGRDEVDRARTELWEIWDEFRFEESEVRDLGDAVVWLGHVHATGSAGVTLDQEFGIYSVIEGGRMRSAKASLSWAETLAAADAEE
jgi:ketosteroid isomerase-like protein